MGKFLLCRVSSGFKFNLLAANGQVIATSEVYGSAAACRKGAESVRSCAATAPVEDLTEPGAKVPHPKFQLYQDKAGRYRFRLRSRNGKIIAASEGYATRSGCENGIQSLRDNAPAAQVEGP